MSKRESAIGNQQSFRERIVMEPRVHFGKPCVAGTRIPVAAVLELIQEGIPFQEIIAAYYPDLESEDVKACARYATALVQAEELHVET
jgi:uncharacterized protein (DUF433 family)